MSSPSEPNNPAERRAVPTLGPAARDQVITLLTHHYAHDTITQADLEERLEHVFKAKTRAELDAIVADLAPITTPASPSVAEPPSTDARSITATFSAQEQRITGTVPRRLDIRARFGYAEVDLAHATFESGLTTIDVRAFMGYVQLRLPVDVRIENDGRAVFGYFSITGVTPETDHQRPVVRITGRAVLGYAEGIVGSGGDSSKPGRLREGREDHDA